MRHVAVPLRKLRPCAPRRLVFEAAHRETTVASARHGAEASEAAGAGFGSGASQKPLRIRGQPLRRGEGSPFTSAGPCVRGPVPAGVKPLARQRRPKPPRRGAEGPRAPLCGPRAALLEAGLAKGSLRSGSPLWPQMLRMWEKQVLYQENSFTVNS